MGKPLPGMKKGSTRFLSAELEEEEDLVRVRRELAARSGEEARRKRAVVDAEIWRLEEEVAVRRAMLRVLKARRK